MLDDLDAVAKKIKRAVTDTDNEVRFDPAAKPGVSNLLSILAACTGRTPESWPRGYTQYGPLKADTAEAVVELLRPIQARYAELAADPAGTAALLDQGRGQGPSVAGPTLARAQAAIGLLAPSLMGCQSSSASLRASASSGATVHWSGGRWCSRAQASVSGSLPAMPSRSPPSSRVLQVEADPPGEAPGLRPGPDDLGIAADHASPRGWR